MPAGRVARMSRMKGADVITEYLIASKIAYVFGICGAGHGGSVGSLCGARGRSSLVSPGGDEGGWMMAGGSCRVGREAGGRVPSCGPGSCDIVVGVWGASSDSSA